MARRKRKVVRDGQEGGSKTSDFFQHSHLISNIGEYALPALGGVAGAALGGLAAPFTGGYSVPVGTALGAAIGKSGNDLIKHAGYGSGSKALRGRGMKGSGYLGGIPISIDHGSSRYPAQGANKIAGGGSRRYRGGEGINPQLLGTYQSARLAGYHGLLTSAGPVGGTIYGTVSSDMSKCHF